MRKCTLGTPTGSRTSSWAGRRPRPTACAVIALGGILAACGGSSGTTGPTARCQSVKSEFIGHLAATVSHIRALGSQRVPIDGQPIAAGLGAVWSASSAGLVRVPAQGGGITIVDRIPIDDVALNSSCVYGLSAGQSQVIEVDPRSLRVTHRWRVEAGSHSLAATDGALYIAYDEGTPGAERIDLRTNLVTRRTIPHTAGLANDRAIAFGAQHVWWSDGGSIYRLDPGRLTSDGSLTGQAVSDVWFGNGSLWAASDSPGGGVERIDPNSLRVLARSSADAIQMAFSPGITWLAAAAGPIALDSTTARTLAVVPQRQVPSNGSAGIAVVGDQVWVTYPDLKRLQRLRPAAG